jgi:hypothetical protein
MQQPQGTGYADMDDVCADRKGNHDILRIFRLKAEHPEKYREEVKIIGAETQVQSLDRLRELAGRERAQREALESGQVVEGEVRELDSKQEGE